MQIKVFSPSSSINNYVTSKLHATSGIIKPSARNDHKNILKPRLPHHPVLCMVQYTYIVYIYAAMSNTMSPKMIQTIIRPVLLYVIFLAFLIRIVAKIMQNASRKFNESCMNIVGLYWRLPFTHVINVHSTCTWLQQSSPAYKSMLFKPVDAQPKQFNFGMTS